MPQRSFSEPVQKEGLRQFSIGSCRGTSKWRLFAFNWGRALLVEYSSLFGRGAPQKALQNIPVLFGKRQKGIFVSQGGGAQSVTKARHQPENHSSPPGGLKKWNLIHRLEKECLDFEIFLVQNQPAGAAVETFPRPG